MQKRIIISLSLITGIYFIIIAGMNFYGAPMMMDTFEKIGVGQWFRYVTAVCQLSGGVALLWPKSRLYGALLLMCVMIGALIAKLAILHGNPLAIIALLIINTFIAWRSRPMKSYLQ